MWWFTAPRIVFGRDALDELGPLLLRGGGRENAARRVALVTDRTMAGRGHARAVASRAEAAGFEVLVVDDVEPEPTLEAVAAGAARIRPFAPRWIVALGGGSVIDAAKAMWALYEHPGLDVGGVTPLEPLPMGRLADFVAVPTTSGTGAEATWAMVLTDEANRAKIAPSSRDLVPPWAVVDPRFADAMPPALTAGSGLDALTHALEACASTWRNDFSDGLAEHAARLVLRWLPVAHREPGNAEARERMHNAACLAGLAFGNAQVGIAHSMGHALGVHFGLHHGRAVGLALPAMLAYSAEEEAPRARYAEVARRLAPGEAPDDDGEATAWLVARVVRLRRDLGEPASLRALGIGESAFRARLGDLVDHALGDPCTVTSPRVPDGDAFRALFASLFAGDAR